MESIRNVARFYVLIFSHHLSFKKQVVLLVLI